jgi:hypothetical protein
MSKTILFKLYLGTLLLIFGLIVLHAPLTVIAGTLLPQVTELVKSWKELLMLGAAVLVIILLTKGRKWGFLTNDKLFWAIIAYACLHLITVALMWQGLAATSAGMAIDLRYILYFILVYIAVQLYPMVRPIFLKIGAIGAAVVTGFAAMQIFLPKDILTHIGYGDTTIAPYNTVDRNQDFIRVNSTLRGPNPLGAYVVIVLTVAISFFMTHYKKLTTRLPIILATVLIVGSIVTLWVSYSRSAALAAFVAVAIVLVYAFGKKVKPLWWIGLGGLAIVIATTGYIVLKDNAFVSNVVLHENPGEGDSVNSNEGHAESLGIGVAKMLQQPFGAGVGSTGTASYYTSTPTIIENQYLFIAHEVGWVGVILFLGIFIEIMRRLWSRRREWLAIGLFASGVGLALVGLLLPVWVDDTVSLVWWGLAAVVIGGGVNGRTLDKKTKRTA